LTEAITFLLVNGAAPLRMERDDREDEEDDIDG